jgi:host factor-I protein
MSNRASTEPVQDPFLNKLRKTNTPVTIYLTNGVRLDGLIASFDVNTILLKAETPHILYKHMVATVQRKLSRAGKLRTPRGASSAALPGFRDATGALQIPASRRQQTTRESSGAVRLPNSGKRKPT